MQKKKSPLLAALLNLFIPGSGYIYVGTRLRFGVLLVGATVLTLAAPTEEGEGQAVNATDMANFLGDPGNLVLFVAAIMIAVAFAYDAWRDANSFNEAQSMSSDHEDDE